MYTFEYRFYPKSVEDPERDEFDDEMQWFISSLYKNGQILRDYQNTVKLHDSYQYRVVAPEKTSLERKLYNKYSEGIFQKVLTLSAKPPELYFIGENYDVQDCCECSDSSHYILDADASECSSPIICGDCGCSVPLYRFPKTYHDEYFDILNWQQVYCACWMQYLQGIGERHGYRMMHSYKSDLAIEGRGICTFLETHTGKPFYYFLFKYYSKNRKECPCCGDLWVNSDQKYNYGYVCHKCRLVSDDIG